ncbi:MAG: tyrosine-protein phosphatase [Pseudomonadota bacterium]|nr:tyrosine-protein phosphatase [Pseudomonadota bacterium]
MTRQLHPEAPNFRSLCGMPLAGGRRVREGRFYRCASPHNYSPAALAQMEALDPYAVVDFRGVEEAAALPYVLPGAIAGRRVAMPVEPKTGDRVRALHEAGKLTEASAREAMRETYRYYVRDNGHTFAKFLALAAEAGDRPIVWHCAAGKDRTGFAAAMILTALAASRDAIVADYLVSNDLWKPHAASSVSTLPQIARDALAKVEGAYLDAAWEALEAEHGSPEAFVAGALGGEAGMKAFLEAKTETV